MNKSTNLKKKGLVKRNHPVSEFSKGYTENVLTPITLSGIVTLWNLNVDYGEISDYKLISYSGLEYFIIANSEWRRILSKHRGEQVKLIGLLNISNMTLIPQKIFPKDPSGKKENIIDIAAWKSNEQLAKIAKNVNDFILVPAAILAVLAS